MALNFVSLDFLTTYYVQFGSDGHLYVPDDQKLAKELFEKQLRNLKAVPEFGKDLLRLGEQQAS